jgi:hypothetical protein
MKRTLQLGFLFLKEDGPAQFCGADGAASGLYGPCRVDDWGCLRTSPHLLHGDSGEPRETQSAGASGRDIDHPTAHIWAPIGDRDDDTAAIGVIVNPHTAPERQCFMRGGQFAIVQSATASSPCAQFARRIMRCNATFGARRSDDGRANALTPRWCQLGTTSNSYGPNAILILNEHVTVLFQADHQFSSTATTRNRS